MIWVLHKPGGLVRVRCHSCGKWHETDQRVIDFAMADELATGKRRRVEFPCKSCADASAEPWERIGTLPIERHA